MIMRVLLPVPLLLRNTADTKIGAAQARSVCKFPQLTVFTLLLFPGSVVVVVGSAAVFYRSVNEFPCGSSRFLLTETGE